jgi:hypothetical protein
VRANTSKAAGKWYWEVKIDTDVPDTAIRVGIGTSAASLDSGVGDNANGYGYGGFSGKKWYNGANPAYGSTYTTGDVIGVALDLDAGKIWWARNNSWQAAGDPAAGANEAYSGVAGTFFPMVSSACNGNVLIGKFNSVDQTYSPPAGFSSICPDIGFILTSALTSTSSIDCNFRIDFAPGPLVAIGALVPGEVRLGDIVCGTPINATASLDAAIHMVIEPCSFSAASSMEATTQIGINVKALSANAVLSCDDCFNYAQIDSPCPTPSGDFDAVFRYARIEASPPVPTASFRVGRIIEGDSPTPDFTCIAYHGRNPSLIAIAPVPICSMRVGLSLDAAVPAPTCCMVATTHHLATIFGNVPTPTCTIIASTENIAIINGRVPVPRGKFTTTIGNVANMCGRCPVSNCSMRALVGTVVSLYGRVPVPGPLVRFYASPLNVTITLAGPVPVPTMTSKVLCSLPSLMLRYERGKIR